MPRRKGIDPFIPEETGQSYSYSNRSGSGRSWGNKGSDRYLPDEDSMGKGSPSYSYSNRAGKNSPRSRNTKYDRYLPDEDSKGPNYNYDRFKGEARYPQHEAGYIPWSSPKTSTQGIQYPTCPSQDNASGPTVMGTPRFVEYGRQEVPRSDAMEYAKRSEQPHDADGYLDPDTGLPKPSSYDDDYQGLPEQMYLDNRAGPGRTKTMDATVVMLPWGVSSKRTPRNPMQHIGEQPLLDWGGKRISELVLNRLGLPVPGMNRQPQEDPKISLLRALTELGVTR